MKAENKAKSEVEVKQREESLEHSREAAEEQRQIREYYYQKIEFDGSGKNMVHGGRKNHML